MFKVIYWRENSIFQLEVHNNKWIYKYYKKKQQLA